MTLKTQLEAFLIDHQPALLDFCTRLVQTPSVNGEHPEQAVAELILAEAAQLGLPAQTTALTPQRPNVIIGTAVAGLTGLLLVGHLDTVPTGHPAHWTYPPFSGHIANGCLYGRGAIDNKGGIAAAMYALAALKAVDGALAGGRAQFVGVPDEESGATGTLGVRFLTQHGLISGLGGIYVYPGTTEIPIGHRGVLRFKLTARGQAAHTGLAGQSGQPAPGNNAVLAMADLLLELESAQLPASTTPYFNRFKAVITPGTIITGGDSVNIVPDFCEALVDVRTIPEFDQPQAQTVIKQAIAGVLARRPNIGFNYQLLIQLPPALSNPAAPLFDYIEQATQAVLNFTPPRVVCGPANEGYLFIEQGIPMACGFGPTGQNAHANDEYVEINTLPQAALIYALTAKKLSRHLAG